MPEPSSQSHEITKLLHAWGSGDAAALDRLMPLVYADLHSTARRYMAQERPGHTIQSTALIHEVYVRLVDSQAAGWQDRAHFFAICSRMMRQILTDFARSRLSLKRGGGTIRVAMEDSLPTVGESPTNLVALDDALIGLERVDARKSQVVELRFFGGLSVQETAEVLKTSEETVKRDWSLAKLWLLRQMTGDDSRGT